MLGYKFLYFMNLMQYCGINLSKSERRPVVKVRGNFYESSVFKKSWKIVSPQPEYSLHVYSFGIRLFLSVTYSKSHVIITVSDGLSIIIIIIIRYGCLLSQACSSWYFS